MSEPEFLVQIFGVIHLSDFFCRQSCYSVTYFSDVLWPEFSLKNLLMVIFYLQRHLHYVQYVERPQVEEENERIIEFLHTMQINYL